MSISNNYKYYFSLKSIFSLIAILCFLQGFAQIHQDSLERILKTNISEKEKTSILLDLANNYISSNPKKGEEILTALAPKLNNDSNPSFIIRYNIIKSIYLRIDQKPKEAKEAAYKALELAEHHKDSLIFKTKIYNSLGSILDDESNIKGAIEHHLIGLRYAEKTNNQFAKASLLGGLGRAYLYISENETAKKYLQEAISIKEELGQIDQNLGTYYTNLSSILDAEGKFEESIAYLDKAIALKKTNKSYASVISAINNKAYTLFLMNKLSAAESNIKEAITIADSLEIEQEQMYTYTTYAEILFAQDRLPLAETYLKKSTDLCKKNNDLYLAQFNIDLLYNINYKKKNYLKAIEYQKQKAVIVDSIYNIKNRQLVEKLDLDYNTEKKNKEIELLNKEKELDKTKLAKSNSLLRALIIIAILSVLVFGLLWNRYKNKLKTEAIQKKAIKSELEQKVVESEMLALRAQMNPHFLFNSLNSINSFIIKNDQAQASQYLSKFSKLIRTVLNNSKLSSIPISDEIEALKLYIELEALRFKNKFNYEINIDESLEIDYLEIPTMLIQPYVENSIWHGLMHKKDGAGKLIINLSKSDNDLICVIEDNGIGRDAAAIIKSKSAVQEKSFGMSITKKRLSFINTNNQPNTYVTVEDLKNELGKPTGTKVTIKIALL